MTRPATMQQARQLIAAKAAELSRPTLAAQWLDHAAKTLPRDAGGEQVRRAERAWYEAKRQELVNAPQTPENLALMAECRGWARLYIGRVA